MKEWPKDPTETVDFSKLHEPIVKMYRKVLKSPNKDHKYTGYNIGKNDRATCCGADEYGKLDFRRYAEEGQGRDVHDLFIQLAIQIGIEQGRRLEKQKILRSYTNP